MIVSALMLGVIVTLTHLTLTHSVKEETHVLIANASMLGVIVTPTHLTLTHNVQEEVPV